MQNQRKERGITLIALIVTLIILVILAAVAISAVYNTKIIEYAVNGAKDYSEEAIKENEILDKTANLLDSAVESIKDMNKNDGENPPEEEEIDDTITEEDIGKYVAYVASTSDNTFKSKKEYSGYTTDVDYVPTAGLKWRILSKEGNKVELISEVGDNNRFYLKGYKGYNNAVALLNNACNKTYVNKELGAVSGRNLKIEDIEEHYTGERATQEENTPTNGKFYPVIFEQEEGGNVNNKGYGSIGRSNMPSTGVNEEGYIEQMSEKQASILKGKYTYYTINMVESNMNKNGEDGVMYTNLFSSSNSSWLASRCTQYNSYSAYFYVFYVINSTIDAHRFYNSRAFIDSQNCVLRPIVTIDLNSVKIKGEGTVDNPYTITKR